MPDETSDDVVVTDHTPRPARPDATEAQAAAETRADDLINDLGRGYVTRRTAVRVRDAADRAIGGHDLDRALDRRG